MWWMYDTIGGAILRKVAIGLLTVVIGLYILFPLDGRDGVQNDGGAPADPADDLPG